MPNNPNDLNVTGQFDTVDNTTITISWDPPQGTGVKTVVDQYNLYINPLPLSHPNFVVAYGEAINVTIQYNMQYNISIVALNCAGESPLVNLLLDEFSKQILILCTGKISYVCHADYAVDCGIPLPPLNGFLGDFIGSKEGNNITFQCDINYVPSAIMESICNFAGMWDPQPMDHLCNLVEGITV